MQKREEWMFEPLQSCSKQHFRLPWFLFFQLIFNRSALSHTPPLEEKASPAITTTTEHEHCLNLWAEPLRDYFKSLSCDDHVMNINWTFNDMLPSQLKSVTCEFTVDVLLWLLCVLQYSFTPAPVFLVTLKLLFSTRWIGSAVPLYTSRGKLFSSERDHHYS